MAEALHRPQLRGLAGGLPAKINADEIDRLFRSTVGLLVEGGHKRWLLEMLVAHVRPAVLRRDVL